MNEPRTFREDLRYKISKMIEKYEDYKKTMGRDNLEKLSEADVKKDFINPLFSALGWKVEDSREYDAETYVRGAGFVDMSIWIEDPTAPEKRVARIFIEAKKFGKIESISERGKQTDLYGKRIVGDWTVEERQILNYAAGYKIKWAVLTNFEKFRVFNAINGLTIIDIDSPADYLERLDDLLYLSKESVYSRRIEDLDKREERPDVDEGFLSLMERWQTVLARDIFERNRSLGLEQIKEATQRILDRFVIVRHAEDRLILDSPDLMKDTYDYWIKHQQFGSLSDMFFGNSQIFHKFDGLYNSKIFERGHICESVKIDDNILGNIIAGLYTLNFRKFSSDILGSTYESYLGGIFNLVNGRLEVVPSMEARKSGGIYYTPRYIVDYITTRTVRSVIEPIWDETLRLLKDGEYSRGEQKFNEITKLKVLDPSMGSGTFLISAFSIFKEYYEKYNEIISEARRKAIVSNGNDMEQYNDLPRVISNYSQKILKDNIYGVDIDPQATEIGAVNLMLQALQKGEKLPLILDENIKTGNSLVPGIVDRTVFGRYEKEISNLIEIRRNLKELSTEGNKKRLLEDEKTLRERIVQEIEEELKISELHPFSDPFYSELEYPEVFFNEDGSLKDTPGFSCIIGNPPYGAKFSDDEKKFLEQRFVHTQGSNSAQFFLELSSYLVSENGDVGMIVPKTIAFYSEWSSIRTFIIDNHEITNLMDVGIGFVDANYEDLILVFTKNRGNGGGNVTLHQAQPVRTYIPNKKVVPLGKFDRALMNQAKTIIFSQIDEKESGIVTKMSSVSHKFEDVFDRVFRGLYIPDEEKKSLKEGKYLFVNKVPDVDRYEVRKLMRIDIESNEKWMEKAKEVMVPRLFLKVMRGKRIVANFDDGSILTTEKLVNVTLRQSVGYKPPFITALLNSPLLSFYIEKVLFSGTTETSRVLDRPYIKYLPIRRIDFTTSRKELISSVQKFRGMYMKALEERRSDAYLVKSVDGLLLKRQDDVVHEILSYLAEQMVILKRQRSKFYETFDNFLKLFRQNAEYRQLKEYVDLKEVMTLKKVRKIEDFSGTRMETDDYSIDLEGVEESISYKEKGHVLGIGVRENQNIMYFQVLLEGQDSFRDMLKIPVKDDFIRKFLICSIKLHIKSNPRKKQWSKEQIYEVLDHVNIPRSVANVKIDAANIRKLMKSFNSRMEKIITEKFGESAVQSPDIVLIEDAIGETDYLIDQIVYRLYGLTEDEKKIVENFALKTSKYDVVVNESDRN